jgi:hypothetical protein
MRKKAMVTAAGVLAAVGIGGAALAEEATERGPGRGPRQTGPRPGPSRQPEEEARTR